MPPCLHGAAEKLLTVLLWSGAKQFAFQYDTEPIKFWYIRTHASFFDFFFETYLFYSESSVVRSPVLHVFIFSWFFCLGDIKTKFRFLADLKLKPHQNKAKTRKEQQQKFIAGTVRQRTFVPARWYCWWKKSCTTWCVWNPVNNLKFIISTGAGFFPSTVCTSDDVRLFVLDGVGELQFGYNWLWQL